MLVHSLGEVGKVRSPLSHGPVDKGLVDLQQRLTIVSLGSSSVWIEPGTDILYFRGRRHEDPCIHPRVIVESLVDDKLA